MFNFVKLGTGVEYELSCSTQGPNSSYRYNTTDNITDVHPCEFGFHYLVASSAVWLVFLPFWIVALLGTCWRQCCCCCCDPLVLCGCIIDLVKRCCCECGRFNCCELIWSVMSLVSLQISSVWRVAGTPTVGFTWRGRGWG